MIMDSLPEELQRYDRQIRYAPLGEAGQRRLSAGRVLLCGCGALGSVIANTLVRAGVGCVRLVDRDFLEWNNLQRQVLFDEDDVRAGLPKAVAAAQKLRRINSQVTIDEVVADVDARNIASLCEGIDVILDGTDNFETRFLLNDAALKFGIPWIYGGCVGAEGQTLVVRPGKTPCLRCILPEPPAPGTTQTCDTAGIVAPIVNVVASMQAMEAIKLLSGRPEDCSDTWNVWDLWENRYRQIRLDQLQGEARCVTCRGQEFPWLDGMRGSQSAVLCGRNAVQLTPQTGNQLDLAKLAEQWQDLGHVQSNPFLVRLSVDTFQLTVFADGRAIIGGTDDVSQAKTLYARYVGS